MKKTFMVLLIILTFLSPAFAARPRGYRGAPTVNGTATKLLNAYYRTMRAYRPSGTPAPRTSPSGPFANVTPGTPSAWSIPGAISGLPPGDRPFDANASGIDPFAPSAPLPGSFASLPVMPGSDSDPFLPDQTTINPFIPGGPPTAKPFATTPLGILLGLESFPGSSSSTGTTAQGSPSIFQARMIRLDPLRGLIDNPNPFKVSPYDSTPTPEPLGPYGNPYSLRNPLTGSSIRISTIPLTPIGWRITMKTDSPRCCGQHQDHGMPLSQNHV